MLYTLTAPGSHSAKYELYRPNCLTVRKVGIRPPLNSIVNANRPVITPRPNSPLRASGYAAIMVQATFIIVPTTVINTAFQKLGIISLFLNTVS